MSPITTPKTLQSSDELWKTALADIELTLSKASFITWFKYTSIIKNSNGIMVIGVPNGFSKEWLENKYNKIILGVLRNLDKGIKEVRFEINSNISRTQIRIAQPNTHQHQLGLIEVKIDKDTNLNPRYTFNSFVVGASNELAYAAALAVTKNIGKKYNPLLIYGGVGLGKTHLLQAIGNEISISYTNKKIKYLSSEKFTNEFIESVRSKDTSDFKNKYRKIDVLIIDDIQFLANKEQTQEEFFHTFNALHDKNKQIILSSDQPPGAITAINERLRSRFDGGMIADISLPDYETRVAILKTKLEEKSQELPDNIIDYLASNIKKSIRELEGALNKVIVVYELNQGLSQNQLIKILADFNTTQQRITTPAKIIETVVKFYDIHIDDIIQRSRKKNLVKPRQVAMYLLREELNYSYPNIGEKFGDRDHSTIIHAYEKIKNAVNNNEELAREIDTLRKKIYIK